MEGWKKLRLTADEEEVAVDVDRAAMEETEKVLNVCLMGKLLAGRSITCEIISNTMKKAWKIENGLSVESMGRNLYLFTFPRVIDRNRVFKTGPWSFDKYLLVLENPDTMVRPDEMDFDKASFWVHFFNLPLGCRNKTMAQRLGNVIGV